MSTTTKVLPPYEAESNNEAVAFRATADPNIK